MSRSRIVSLKTSAIGLSLSVFLLSIFLLISACMFSGVFCYAQANTGRGSGVTFFARPGGSTGANAASIQMSDAFSSPGVLGVSFLPAVTYSTGEHNPYSVAIADVNGDHKPDLIVANQGNFTEGSVSVMLGNGDGTFQPATNYDSGAELAYSVAVADVNGDGKLDIIVGDSCNGSDCSKGGVGVLLGNGDGTFQHVVVYALAGGAFYGSRVAVGDLNGDGKLDIAVSTASDVCCAAGSVNVLLGKGNGTFQKAVAYGTGGYNGLGSVAIADVNGDGKADLVAANYCSTHCSFPPSEGSVGVLIGNGDGTFQPVVTYLTGDAGTVSVAVADLNHDGKPDLVAASCGPQACGPGSPGGMVGVLLGNGDGTFRTVAGYRAGNGSWSVVVKDVNGDGKPDVIVSNWGTPDAGSNAGAVTVLLNKGNGRLEPAVTFPSGGAESPSVAVADVNGDGVPDIALACVDDSLEGTQGVASILINTTDIPPQKTSTTVTTSGSPSFVGQPVTFTATVSSNGTPVPDGDLVTFFDGKTQLASVPLSGGVAAYTTSALSAKKHTIKAEYAGDTRFLPSSGSVKQVVQLYATSTALTSNPNPSTAGELVTFTAKVSSSGPDTPTGKVMFKDGSKSIGSATLSGGVATLTDSKLTVGTHAITAVYRGDAESAGSTSPVVNQVVNAD